VDHAALTDVEGERITISFNPISAPPLVVKADAPGAE